VHILVHHISSVPGLSPRQPVLKRAASSQVVLNRVGDGPALVLFAEHYPERDAVVLERLGLSSREAEVLWRIAKGASAAEIEQGYAISVSSVGHHVQRVYIKLGVSTRTAAIALACEALMLREPRGGP